VTANETFSTVRGIVEAGYDTTEPYLQISPVANADLAQ
jgi:hypothetical protein